MSKFKRMNNNGLNVGTFVPTNANENVGTFVPTNAKRRGNRNGKLTPKQARFIDEYLKDLNATQAAIRAGYSPKTAQEISSETLSKPIIQEAVQKRRNELSAKAQMDQEWVLNNYKKLVDYTLEEIYDDDGNLLPISQMSENARFASYGLRKVKKKAITINKDGSKKLSETNMHELKFTDKKAVFDQIGKHLGMFKSEEGQESGNKFNFNAPMQINVGLVEEDADS